MTDTGDADEPPCGSDPALDIEWAEEALWRVLRLQYWSEQEAVYVLNGLDPEESRLGELEDNPFVHLPYGLAPGRTGWDRESLRLNIEVGIAFVRERIAVEGRHGPRTPREWLMFADANGMHVLWLEFARSRPKLRRFLPEGEEDQAKTIEEQRDTIARLTAENERLHRENEALQPFSGKAAITAYKLIGGMAKGCCGLDLQEPETKAFKELTDDLARAGATLSDNTVRTWLRRSAGYLERP